MDIKPIGGRMWRTGAGQDDLQETEDIKGALEAMLLVASDPLMARRMAEILQCDEGKVLSALQELRDEYVTYNRGMQLREVGGGWRMHTHPAYASHIEKLMLSARRVRLTRAAVETLAIIAYLQPITRGQVANLRGVQSENMVKVLEEHGLVSEAGKERAPGGPVLYVTTDAFIERFGLNSLDDLTPLEDFEPDTRTVERIANSLSGRSGNEDAGGGSDQDYDYDRDISTAVAGAGEKAAGREYETALYVQEAGREVTVEDGEAKEEESPARGGLGDSGAGDGGKPEKNDLQGDVPGHGD